MTPRGRPEDVEARLANLPAPVRLLFFTQTFGCDTCLPARQVADQIASFSDQITVEEYNLVLDKEKVAEYGIDKVPAIAVVGAEDLDSIYEPIAANPDLRAIVAALAENIDVG